MSQSIYLSHKIILKINGVIMVTIWLIIKDWIEEKRLRKWLKALKMERKSIIINKKTINLTKNEG